MFGAIVTETIIILTLVLANSFLSLAAMAIAYARKAKLHERAENGATGAKKALELVESQTSVIAAVQTCSTFICILAGAIAGGTIADELARYIQSTGALSFGQKELSLALVVVVIGYLSIVFGLLVPKRLALRHADDVACLVAAPMDQLSRVITPIVQISFLSTDWVLKVFGVKDFSEPNISEREIKILIEQGEKGGILDPSERKIMEEALQLNDRLVSELMTPRLDVVWLDLDKPWSYNLTLMLDSPHHVFPVSRGQLDDYVGVVNVKSVFRETIKADGVVDLEMLVYKPLGLPPNMTALRALEKFREAKIHAAMVLDQYGGIDGLITINDVFESIVGVMPEVGTKPKWEMVERDEGIFLADGRMPVQDFRQFFDLRKQIEKEGRFSTVGGFVVHSLKHIPTEGESFSIENLCIEVIDMDRHRVDKVQVSVRDLTK